jgi:DNA-binding CsgD family transcriptional regulator
MATKSIHLTNVEKTIFICMINGMTNREIANGRKCSVRTVENHRYRMCQKFDVPNTASLVYKVLTTEPTLSKQFLTGKVAS